MSSKVMQQKQYANQSVGYYPEHAQIFVKFLQNFEDEQYLHPKFLHKKYMGLLQDVANHKSETITVDIPEMNKWCAEQAANDQNPMLYQAFWQGLRENTWRYQELFYEACCSVFPDPDKHVIEASTDDKFHFDSEHWRQAAKDSADQIQAEQNEQGNAAPLANKNALVPPKLQYPFEVRFAMTVSKDDDTIVKDMRAVRADQIGKYVTFNGVVSRCTPVKPKVQVAVYTCELCGARLFQLVNSDEYTPLVECISQSCKSASKFGKLSMTVSGSKYINYQEMRIQEMSSEVPVGSIPRHLNVILEGDIAKNCSPGDAITLSGCYLPHLQGGAMGSVPRVVNFVHAHCITHHKQGFVMNKELGVSLETQLEMAMKDPKFYDKLANSIAPQVFGMTDVKKALLLALVGGCGKQMSDGMKVRGDIHIMLMGDPGVAKSQLLKQVCNVAPRAVYTTGKGSSGVGLTATVSRDNTTGELSLEGGALVIADSGVCCIDEFDKMEEKDRSAIHEVMEQQCVSIAKAGLTTSLNARTTVFAAANPIFGRYNPDKSPIENMGLPASLLSRFDLKFLLLDYVDNANDINLASYVLDVHRNKNDEKSQESKHFPVDLIRSYIKRAKQHSPLIPQALEEKIVLRYVKMREEERTNDERDERKDYVTPRQLLGMIRLACARARLRFSNVIEEGDWEEAIRLTEASKASVTQGGGGNRERTEFNLNQDLHDQDVEMDDVDLDDDALDKQKMARDLGSRIGGGNVTRDMFQQGGETDYKTEIFAILEKAFQIAGQGSPVHLTELNQHAVQQGFSDQEFLETVDFYRGIGVLEYNDSSKTALQWITN